MKIVLWETSVDAPRWAHVNCVWGETCSSETILKTRKFGSGGPHLANEKSTVVGMLFVFDFYKQYWKLFFGDDTPHWPYGSCALENRLSPNIIGN